jgi:hypothetical protein
VERVTDALQILDAQHPRAADGGHAPLDAGARERRGEELAQALLQHGDLTTKLVACQPIGGGPCWGLDGGGLGCPNRLID